MIDTTDRRRALLRLAALTGQLGAAAALAGCGGGAATPPAPLLATPQSPSPPPPPPPPPPGPPPPPAIPGAAAVARLKAALSAAQPATVLARPVDVAQNVSNEAVPLAGATATVWPTPRGFGVNPNPVVLADVPHVWCFRSAQWTRGAASFSGGRDVPGSWFVPLNFLHPTPGGLTSGAHCAFHFVLDGTGFEVLFAGTDFAATVLADGQHAAPAYITRRWAGGNPGAALGAYDTFTRIDFGSRAVRRISLFCRSTIGPKALAVAAGETLAPWDRSAEPSMTVMTDSYGQALSTRWGPGGLFREAAALLGIPHMDADPIGGTGYAPNNANEQTRNPGNAFVARLPGMTREASDLFIVAGGINDNNGVAAPPLYASAADAKAGFDQAVLQCWTQLRALQPEAVLVGLGPWQPNAQYFPETARSKADTVLAAMRTLAGPWIFVDNVAGGWVNSAGASATGTPWQTGTGNEATPRGDGNGDLYLSSDGTHPNAAGVSYLAGRLAESLKAALQAL